MAHTKAGGTKAGQGGQVAGKRLGVKAYGGAYVTAGAIIVRQRGQTFLAGKNVKLAKDYTLFSLVNGIVQFKNKTRAKKLVNVLPNLPNKA